MTKLLLLKGKTRWRSRLQLMKISAFLSSAVSSFHCTILLTLEIVNISKIITVYFNEFPWVNWAIQMIIVVRSRPGTDPGPQNEFSLVFQSYNIIHVYTKCVHVWVLYTVTPFHKFLSLVRTFVCRNTAIIFTPVWRGGSPQNVWFRAQMNTLERVLLYLM